MGVYAPDAAADGYGPANAQRMPRCLPSNDVHAWIALPQMTRWQTGGIVEMSPGGSILRRAHRKKEYVDPLG